VWAWLGWIVPIVSWWFPKQILDDSIKATDNARGPAGAAVAPGGAKLSTTPYWASWVIFNLLTNLQFRLAFQADPEDAIVPSLEFAVAIVATVALVFWVPLVRNLTAQQNAAVTNSWPR
jgi:hypothetical protein